MKKFTQYFIQVALLLNILAFSRGHKQEIQDKPAVIVSPLVHSSMESVNLIKTDGSVDENLLAFLSLYEVKHDGTVEGVDKAMQEKFLRKPNLERRDLSDTPLDQELRQRAIGLLTHMGFVAPIPHTTVAVDYFLLFGAMIGGIEKRFGDFVEQYNQGTLQCKNLVLLGGVRTLRQHEIEAIEGELGEGAFKAFLAQVNKLDKQTLTEADLFRFVWKTRATDSMKATFKEGENLFFVNATRTTDGTNNRPVTATTLEAWYADYHPEPGSCHGNVEKPYGVRMEKTLRLFLEKQSQILDHNNKQFSITWNSPKANEDLPLAVYKDELARAFHTELSLKHFIKKQQVVSIDAPM